MNAEKYTQKSLEAVREAQELVIRNNNTQIDQQHLLKALIDQENGVAGELIKKMGADTLYEVMFDTVGTKKLMATFAKLKRAGS